MLNYIQMEFYKLKRSRIFLLTLFGAILPSLLMFIATFAFNETQSFEALFTNVNLYTAILFGIMIYAIIISYLFGREYNEHTLKTILTIPTSRGKYLISKYLMFLIWVLILTITTTSATLIFGFLAGLDGFTIDLLINSFKELLINNVLLYLSFTPFVFLSLIVTNMVPAMIGGAGLTLVNMLVHGQDWAPYNPWTIPYIIASGTIAEYNVNVMIPYLIITLTFIMGLAVSYLYFTRVDVKL